MKPYKTQKAEQVNMTYSAFLIRDIHIFSDNFSRLLASSCAAIPARNGKKFGDFLAFYIKKDPADTPFYKVFN